MWFRVAGGLWFVITGFVAIAASPTLVSLGFALGVLGIVAGVALLAGK